MQHENIPFSIPAFRHFVPAKLRPWLIVVFVMIFQLSGGVYLAAVSEMVGSLALMQEDIMMAGYASLVGLALTFTIMFRLKFRFTSKWILLTCCTAIIIGNLICMHTHSVVVLVVTCFVLGIFRMWATFACNTQIQLWLTPTRDLSIFFCFVNVLVQGCMQVSGLMTIYTAFFSVWEYMHLVIIGLLGMMMLAIVFLFRTHREVRKLPLYGIDWLGGLLWGLTVLAIIFICVYGEHFDWWQSPYICTATIAAVVMLGLNLWRASFIRHPYINLNTWTFRVVYMTLIAYIVIDILLAPAHVFEHIYMEAILGYDTLTVISLNWVMLAGIVAGCFFTWRTFAIRKWRYSTMHVIGLACIIAYLFLFYFGIDYNLPKTALMLPIFLRGFGYVVIAICFLTILTRVPFIPNFPQSLTVQAFFSASLGGVIGDAVVSHFLKLGIQWNSMFLGAELDNTNVLAHQHSTAELYGMVQQQALMVSMKDLYGWLALLGIFCLLLILLNESDIRPRNTIEPTYKVIRKMIMSTYRRFNNS
ncbi:hypothetical protein EZS27_010079 [termite gut metagenome]|uniref:MFS transporter n=1 Tax=termite gut metagenome TaxID=433724 RepID=A0A5J4S7R7_9ZZZZ